MALFAKSKSARYFRVTKIQKGSDQSNRKRVASVTPEQVRKIAEDKMPDLNCFTVDAAVKMVEGTARSMGIAVTGSSSTN